MVFQEQEKLQQQLKEELLRNSKLVAQQEHLIGQQQQTLSELERSRQAYQQREQQLSSQLAQLASLHSQQQNELQQKAQLFKTLQLELKTAQQSGNESIEQLQQRERAIAQLQRQIQEREIQNQAITSELFQLREKLQETHQQAFEAQEQIADFNFKFAAFASERDRALQKASELEQRLAATPDVIELKAALEVAKQEAERIEQSNQETVDFILNEATELENRNRELVSERDELQLKVWELEEEIEWYTKTLTSQPQLQNLDEPTSLPVPQTIALSSLSLALVGGHHRTRREVIDELSQTYNLKDCREIPPSSEQYFNGHSVREAISHCHLIAVITRYVGHDLTELVSDLHQSGALRGEVLRVNCRGKSGIVREILNHVTSQAA